MVDVAINKLRRAFATTARHAAWLDRDASLHKDCKRGLIQANGKSDIRPDEPDLKTLAFVQLHHLICSERPAERVPRGAF